LCVILRKKVFFKAKKMVRSNHTYKPLMIACLVVSTSCSPILTQRDQKAAIPPVPTVDPESQKETPLSKPVAKITPVSGVPKADTRPGEPQGSAQIIHDQTCASTAQNKRAPGGDEYTIGRFERPFDREMKYLPALDIVRAELTRPLDGWVYFKIILEAIPAPSPTVYGIELDLNIDGRGDYLIQAAAPTSSEWAESGIKMWWDSDGDVGGQVINRSDPMGNKGSGFESLKINSDAKKNPGQIWSRFLDKGLEIAVKEDLIGGKQGKFTWKPYTDGNPFPPSQYDLNDYYLLPQAGSPIFGERDYPLKAVFALDNTCRGLSGLKPSGSEQGVCPP
jgi:hypothetical protein